MMLATGRELRPGLRQLTEGCCGAGNAAARFREIGWVADHLADLESDFSVFHRVDDIYAMDGPRFLRFAWRIAAYDGMITRHIESQREPAPVPAPAAAAPARSVPAPSRAPSTPGATTVPLAQMAMGSPGLFEVVKVPRT